MATWQYTTHNVVAEIRGALNDYMGSHDRPKDMDDQTYAAHVLAEVFTLPIIRWLNENEAMHEAERAARGTPQEGNADENDN